MASRDLENTPTLHSRRPDRAGRSPSARWLVLCAAVVATALVTAAAAQSKPVRRLESPQLSEISRASRPIVDTQLTTAAAAAAPAGYWGGEYRASTGEAVTVYASNSYPVDPALGQRWADFLATLVHGSELSTVTVLLSTPEQISSICGQDAVRLLQRARSAALCARRGSRAVISPPRRSSRTSTATTSPRIGPTRRGLPSTGAPSAGPPRCRCARRRAGRSRTGRRGCRAVPDEPGRRLGREVSRAERAQGRAPGDTVADRRPGAVSHGRGARSGRARRDDAVGDGDHHDPDRRP